MKLGIICYPNQEIDEIINACAVHNVETKVIDFFDSNWKSQCTDDLNGYIVRPPCLLQEHKTIYDERIYFINTVMGKPIYPSLNEQYTYENKRNMALFLEHFDIPHAKTKVYLDFKTVNQELDSIIYPVVVKSNIGASASGVTIVKNKKHLRKIANKIFGRVHSAFAFGLAPRKKVRGINVPLIGAAQKHFIIIQEYIDLKCEWRMIRIGDSLFGHQKLIGNNGFASGSLLVGWDTPPKELLQLLSDVTDKMNMDCMVLDIFEDHKGNFFINEMQSIIGAERPYQMKVNNIPGRYKKIDGEFIFEEGEHCTNKCWDLRVEHFIKKLTNQ